MTEKPVNRIITGYGRSGTTWILDALAKANRLRAVFEPLHPLHIGGANDHARRYISAADDDPELYQFLNHFFSEDYRSLWADYRTVKHHLFPQRRDLRSWRRCRNLVRRYRTLKDSYLRFNRQRKHPQRIVKLIRANMMLPWLQAKFNARIVFVIRHPAAVIMSQMRAPKSWDPFEYIDRYRTDTNLLDVLDHQTRQLLSGRVDDVEAYALCWCIENMIALEQAARSGIPVIYYELLVERGMPEWQRIVSALKLEQTPDEQLILQPSQQTWGQKATDSKLLLEHASWMREIGSSMSSRIQRVLDTTSMKVYDLDHPLPNVASGMER